MCQAHINKAETKRLAELGKVYKNPYNFGPRHNWYLFLGLVGGRYQLSHSIDQFMAALQLLFNNRIVQLKRNQINIINPIVSFNFPDSNLYSIVHNTVNNKGFRTHNMFYSDRVAK